MTIDEALTHFRSAYELCQKIDIAQSNFTRWKRQNFIPVAQQLKINQVTGLNMPIDLDKEAMEKRIKRNKKE
ncbi:TPA: bacteriophage CI repressor [Legionella pneumophila]|nr:bacteriophage CI repressor [Legionella pneumophila]